MSKPKLVILIIAILASLYMTVGGIANILINEKFEAALELPEKKVALGNSVFHNVEYQQANAEYEKMLQFFPLYSWLGETVSYLFTLMAFGMLGAIIRILMMSLSSNPNFSDRMYTALVLGCCMGLLTIVVSEVLPEFKAKSGNDKVFYTMALVGGLFTLEVFQWLKSKFSGYIKNNGQEGNENGNNNGNNNPDPANAE